MDRRAASHHKGPVFDHLTGRSGFFLYVCMCFPVSMWDFSGCFGMSDSE